MSTLSPLWSAAARGEYPELFPGGILPQSPQFASRLAQLESSFPMDRRQLAAHLTADQRHWGAAAPALTAAQSLENSATLCVVTGQQAGLLGGSVLSIYKAWSAIGYARDLAVRLGRPVVPIFWIPGDDSDLAECNFLSHPWQSEILHLPFAEPRAPLMMGERTFPPDSVAHVAAFTQSWLSPESRDFIADTMAIAGTGPVDFFARFLHRIFASQGLVVVDAARAWVAEAEQGVLRTFLRHASAIAEALGSGAAQLQALGFAPAMDIPPAMSRVFLRQGRTRRRLGVGEIPPDSALLGHDALSRMAATDAVLPVLAHVLGPGELNYFAQSAPLWSFLERPAPVVAPRCQARLFKPEHSALAQRLGVALPDLPHLTPRNALQGLQGELQGHWPPLDIPGSWASSPARTALERRLAAVEKWYRTKALASMAEGRYPGLQGELRRAWHWFGQGAPQERRLPAALFLESPWASYLENLNPGAPHCQDLG